MAGTYARRVLSARKDADTDVAIEIMVLVTTWTLFGVERRSREFRYCSN